MAINLSLHHDFIAKLTMRPSTIEDKGSFVLIPGDIVEVDGKLTAIPRRPKSLIESPVFISDPPKEGEPSEPQKLFPKYELNDLEIVVANAYQNETAFELIATEEVSTHEEFMKCIKFNLDWFHDWALESEQRAEKPYYKMLRRDEEEAYQNSLGDK